MKPMPTGHAGTRARKFGIAALASAMLLVALAPGTLAGAAPRPIVFDFLQLGSQCVYATAPAGVPVELVWKASSGALKLRETQVTNEFGDLYYCSGDPAKLLAIGDRLKATGGSLTHRLVLPALTIKVDRVLNKVKGTAPAGSTLRVECGNGPLPAFEPCIWTKRVTSSTARKWSARVPWDVIGGQQMSVRWTNAGGDKVYAAALAPFVTVTLDKARFSGAVGVGKTAHLTLSDPSTHDVKASGDGVGDPVGGRFTGQFRDAMDNTVPVSPGDELSPDVAPDANLIVPDIDATASASSNVVSGRCFDTGRSERTVFLQLFRAGDRAGWALEGTEEDGSFSIDFLEDGVGFCDPVDVEAGDSILVTCVQIGGDWVQREIVAGA